MVEGYHFVVRALKVSPIRPNPSKISLSLYFIDMPASENFSVPIMHWSLLTGSLQKISLFRLYDNCLSLC